MRKVFNDATFPFAKQERCVPATSRDPLIGFTQAEKRATLSIAAALPISLSSREQTLRGFDRGQQNTTAETSQLVHAAFAVQTASYANDVSLPAFARENGLPETGAQREAGYLSFLAEWHNELRSGLLSRIIQRTCTTNIDYGLSAAYLYVSTFGSFASPHVEDGFAASGNFLHKAFDGALLSV